MASVKMWGRVAARFLDDNAPVVLTAVAVVGASSIGYLTFRATNQAMEKLTEEYKNRQMVSPTPILQLSQLEKAKVTWTCYIPAVAATTLTIGAVIGANRISAQRAAGLAAAYAGLDRAYSEYRDKVAEKFNPTKEQQVRDEIAQDRVTANPTDASVFLLKGQDVLCYDKPNDRYFESSMEDIRTAQNDVNAEINYFGQATLELLYSSIGLSPTIYSHEIGFTEEVPCDIKFSTVMSTDKRPAMSIDYRAIPLRGFSANETM